MILVDTDVLIQIRRGDSRALAWLQSLGDDPLPIPGVVALEFLIGSRDRFELERSKRFVETLDVQWHEERDHVLAYDLIAQFCLSTGLGIPDFLIAAQALNREATLFTFNLKHFKAIPGLDARVPYDRNPS